MNLGHSTGQGAFFDSGTTFIYVAYDLFNALKDSFKKFCSKSKILCGGFDEWKSKCFDYNKNENYFDVIKFKQSFPIFDFDMGTDDKYRLYPTEYLVQESENSNSFCIGIEPLKNMILGAIFWRNYDIHINKDNKQIGFIRSKCSEDGHFDFLPSNTFYDRTKLNNKDNNNEESIFFYFDINN